MTELYGQIEPVPTLEGSVDGIPLGLDYGLIPIPATAEVGQILSVLTVDENGKLRAVEAIDLPTIGGEIPIAEDFEVPGFAQGSSGKYTVTVPIPLGLVGGASYRIIWNGTEYNCDCYTEFATEDGAVSATGLFLGNASLVQSNLPDTGERFFVMDTGDGTMLITSDEGESHTVSLYLVDRAATEGFVKDYVEQNIPDGIATEDYVRTYVAQNTPEELPEVSAEDNDKILQVVDGAWAKVEKASPPTSINMSGFESEGRIVETFADGSTATTVMEFDADGNPTKITDSNGNVTVLTW